jgi:hypothetical protein
LGKIESIAFVLLISPLPRLSDRSGAHEKLSVRAEEKERGSGRIKKGCKSLLDERIKVIR